MNIALDLNPYNTRHTMTLYIMHVIGGGKYVPVRIDIFMHARAPILLQFYTVKVAKILHQISIRIIPVAQSHISYMHVTGGGK